MLPSKSGLVGVLAPIFLTQVLTSEDLETWNLAIPAWDLVRQGGQDLVLARLNGEWWRYFAAPLLHANLLHILLNDGVVIYSGQYVERRLGGCSLLGIPAAGAIGGDGLAGGRGRGAEGASVAGTAECISSERDTAVHGVAAQRQFCEVVKRHHDARCTQAWRLPAGRSQWAKYLSRSFLLPKLPKGCPR